MSNALIRKLQRGALLSEDDQAVIEAACRHARIVGARQDLISEGQQPTHVRVVLDGVACRYKMLPDGQRSIMALLLPGDFCDLHVAILGRMDHAIATISPCTVVDIPRATIEELTRRASIARACWWATLVDESILREWLVNMGKRTATRRLAHLFCEVFVRLHAVGRATASHCKLPLTQQELGEVLGLSTVHVNRTLQTLREARLIEFRDQQISFRHVKEAMRYADFNPNYLHQNTEDEGAAADRRDG